MDKARSGPTLENVRQRSRAGGRDELFIGPEGEGMRIVTAITLATMAGAALAATTDWQPLGENANGNKVYVDKANLKATGGTTVVTFRTELKTPVDTLQGGITSMRSQMRVRCKDMMAAGIEVILFENEAKNQAFARNKAAKVEYLKEPEGSSADMVVKHVCKK